MSNEEVAIKEQCGSLGKVIHYSKQGQNTIASEQVSSRDSVAASLTQTALGFFREVLLPYGYPDSVSKDYFEYQLWDTLQAFCSTITGIFTTQAILKGMGVGNAEASALSATITWIMKDGTGMLGRIIFAWWKGNNLDCDCKKWRLFADFLNDGAMILELSIPYFSQITTEILCISTVMKSVVGVAGGATRASITNHQAVKGNMAEISAKDGSQETLVNLIASFTGIFLINYFTDSASQWVVTLLLVVLHLYSNYRAVTALVFRNLNNSRMILVLKNYWALNTVLNTERINNMEPVLLGSGSKTEELCGFKIVLGQSLESSVLLYNFDELKDITEVYKNKKYFIIPDLNKRTINVAFEKGEQPEDIIAGYFHAVLLSLAICIYNNIPVDMNSKRQLHHATPLTRLQTFMKGFPHGHELPRNLPRNLFFFFSDFADLELEMFFTALQLNGWKTNTHSLYVNEWRIQWKDLDKKAS